MSSHSSRSLELSKLEEGLPGLTPAFGACLAEAAAVCLEDRGHSSVALLKVGGHFDRTYNVRPLTVTEQMRRTWNDLEVTTEHGAYGVAILLIIDLTNYTVLERSRKRTGFDFWLGEEVTLPFQNKARLEVSGIREGDAKAVNSRVQAKLRQMGSSSEHLPGYVIVVEFSHLLARVVQR